MDVEDRPGYHRRMPEVNEAVVATYLAGGNTRQIRGAPTTAEAAPLSKSAVSRVVATLKDGLEAWRTRSLPISTSSGRCLTRRAQTPPRLELCGGDSFAAWKGCLDDPVARGLRAPVLCIIDGNAGRRRAVGLVWPKATTQRCCVHKLRNLERESGGDELLTSSSLPKAQWKTLRTTNTIERLNDEFRRRVKTTARYRARTPHGPALQPRSQWADQVAQDERLAEDCPRW
jgi:transposase-like protein